MSKKSHTFSIGCVLLCILIAISSGLIRAQSPTVPAPVSPSGLRVALELVGRAPSHNNLTSPVAVGAQLLLIDQSGYIFSWDGAMRTLLTPATLPGAITGGAGETILNAAADAQGTNVFVMFTSPTLPNGIPQRLSPRTDSDKWQVLYRYTFDGVSLASPQAIIALQVRSTGHTGGGLLVLDDGTLLATTGDNGDAFEDGRQYPQDPLNHLGKILRIDPFNQTATVVALGVRNVQRLFLDPNNGDPRLEFIDIGGSIAEELNTISLFDLLAPATLPNFGWGRNAADQRAREGTFYIDQGGATVGTAPQPEPGFLQPVAQFGREGATLVGASGPIGGSIPSFSQLTSLFSDLVSGRLYGTTAGGSTSQQTVYEVSIADASGQQITLAGLAGGRPDPRMFLFPDGTAGVLLEKTGDFFRVTELTTDTPPTVAITAPPTGGQFVAPASLTIAADASDNGGILSVTFQANGTPIASDSTNPYSVSWNNVPAGTYILTAVATDGGGQTTTSDPVTITVSSPPNSRPEVTVTSPAANTTFNAPATISLSASARDVDGSVGSVAFYQNGKLIGADGTAPYAIQWTNVMGGNYTLTAVATDNVGATTTSNAVKITVRGRKK